MNEELNPIGYALAKVKGKTCWQIPINFCMGGVAATLKTSNHRAGNITHPEGGRAEMGILIIYK